MSCSTKPCSKHCPMPPGGLPNVSFYLTMDSLETINHFLKKKMIEKRMQKGSANNTIGSPASRGSVALDK